MSYMVFRDTFIRDILLNSELYENANAMERFTTQLKDPWGKPDVK